MSLYFATEEARILMFGLDAAGKTTILYVTKLGEVVTTIPTIGFNVETIKFGKMSVTAWDVGGRDKIRPLWRHYYQNTTGIVFVVDSNDRERVTNAHEELQRTLREDELREIPVLVFANKQDLPNALSPTDLIEELKLNDLTKSKRNWYIQPCSATEKKGITEGFEWLVEAMRQRKRFAQPIIETVNDSAVITKDVFNMWNSLNVKTLISKFV